MWLAGDREGEAVVEREVVAENFPEGCSPYTTLWATKGRARDGGIRRGPREVQLRLATALTFDAYVTGAGRKTARLSSCPVCEGAVASHGTYIRKRPKVAEVARFYCEACRMKVGILPDFYASRMPGLLDDLEEVVAVAELARSVEAAAQEVRPADEPEAVTLTSALRWLRRRQGPGHQLLATVIGLLPGRLSQEDVPRRIDSP